jgi:hypothetical protein
MYRCIFRITPAVGKRCNVIARCITAGFLTDRYNFTRHFKAGQLICISRWAVGALTLSTVGPVNARDHIADQNLVWCRVWNRYGAGFERVRSAWLRNVDCKHCVSHIGIFQK